MNTVEERWKNKRVSDTDDKAKDHFTVGELQFLQSEITQAKLETIEAIAEEEGWEETKDYYIDKLLNKKDK